MRVSQDPRIRLSGGGRPRIAKAVGEDYSFAIKWLAAENANTKCQNLDGAEL
jgi:ribosomal protein L15E